mmetsp:Transcript_40741/g.39338  ORF Transcript_40741/g.39338 Transcript_40741/m.39338 type:complete len:119 (-) Transcript_40741:246-602(-)
MKQEEKPIEKVRKDKRKGSEIKSIIRDLDRSGEKNLYGRFSKIRESKKEKDSNLEKHLHPDLASNERVTIQKFERKRYKRGLSEEEAPFPVSPKIGPYIVEDPVFGAKNYYWCSCGMS